MVFIQNNIETAASIMQQFFEREQIFLDRLFWNKETIFGITLLLVMSVYFFYLAKPSIQMYPKEVTGQHFATLIYTDERGGTLLKAPSYGLQGKPDYIFKTWMRGKYIPYEIKSGINKEEFPHEGDLMQLVAYFLIIEEVYGKKPPYGKLVYANKTFIIQNTKRFRKQLLQYVWQMEQTLERGPQITCTKSYIKCKNCICKDTVCTCEEE